VRILIASDKFKGSLNSREVADNIAVGLREVLPEAVIETMAVADGGEGTASAISQALGGEKISCPAHDALGHEIEAEYFWLADRATAVMEMSAAAGLWRIRPGQRDLVRSDTFGVGELINDAVRRGSQEILIGLGGSATNDGGFGMARALGFQFLVNEHEAESAVELVNLHRIKAPTRRLTARITAAVDVRNPLLGSRGATRTFGPQKGGTTEQLELLENGLNRLADVVAHDLGSDFRDTPGAGAAGGLGFGLMSFCGATIKPGFDVVAELIGLRDAMAKADIYRKHGLTHDHPGFLPWRIAELSQYLQKLFAMWRTKPGYGEVASRKRSICCSAKAGSVSAVARCDMKPTTCVAGAGSSASP